MHPVPDSCTDDTRHRTDGTLRSGIIPRPVPRTVPRPQPRWLHILLLCVTPARQRGPRAARPITARRPIRVRRIHRCFRFGRPALASVSNDPDLAWRAATAQDPVPEDDGQASGPARTHPPRPLPAVEA
jgi:hypothetical protein